MPSYRNQQGPPSLMPCLEAIQLLKAQVAAVQVAAVQVAAVQVAAVQVASTPVASIGSGTTRQWIH
jgi:hypothetical protein